MDLDSQKSTCSTSVRSYLLYTKRPHRLQACQPHSFLVPFPIFAVEHVGIRGNPHRGFFTHAFRLYAPHTVIHYTTPGLLNRLKTASSPYAAAPNCTSPARWGVRTVPATRITALMSVQTNPFTTYPLSALTHSHALPAVRSRSCWTAPIDYLVRTRVLYGRQDSRCRSTCGGLRSIRSGRPFSPCFGGHFHHSPRFQHSLQFISRVRQPPPAAKVQRQYLKNISPLDAPSPALCNVLHIDNVFRTHDPLLTLSPVYQYHLQYPLLSSYSQSCNPM